MLAGFLIVLIYKLANHLYNHIYKLIEMSTSKSCRKAVLIIELQIRLVTVFSLIAQSWVMMIIKVSSIYHNGVVYLQESNNWRHCLVPLTTNKQLKRPILIDLTLKCDGGPYIYWSWLLFWYPVAVYRIRSSCVTIRDTRIVVLYINFSI